MWNKSVTSHAGGKTVKDIPVKSFLKTVMIAGIILTLSLTSCGSGEPVTNDSAEVIKTQDLEDGKEQEKTTGIQHDEGQADKTETVYTKASASGTPLETTVETVLKNPGSGDEIKDFSNLTDIKNTEGDEKFAFSPDGTLCWENNGQDIQYEGTSSQELPVDVTISYYLDGNKISPEELAGKTGNLRMRFEYENHTSESVTIKEKEITVPVPFTVISAFLLSNDTASNIQVTNGKVISIGEQKMVVGYACPGLAESLQLADCELTEEISLPEYVEVTANVTDFNLEFTASIVSAGLFDEVESEDLNDLESVSEDMKELGRASGKLVDGAAELFEGMDAYQSYLDQYLDGVSALANGANTMEESLKLIDSQKDALAEGASAIQQGLAGLNTALWQVNLAGGTDLDMEEMQTAVTSLAADTSKLGEALSAVETGFVQIQNFVQEAYGYHKAVQDSTDSAISELNQTDLEKLKKQASDLAKYQAGEAAEQAVKEALAAVNLSDTEKSQIRNMVKERVQNAVDLGQVTAEAQGHLDEARAKLSQIPDFEIPDLTIDTSAVTEIVRDMMKQVELLGTSGKALTSLAEKLSAMNDSLDAMKDGVSQLLEGSTRLAEGLAAFHEGIGQICAGSEELGSGTSQLASSGAVLNEGFGALADGMKALKEGLKTFDEEGIAQLKDLAGDDLRDLSVRMKAVKQADAMYDNFGGIREGQTGSVRFMIETEGIG